MYTQSEYDASLQIYRKLYAKIRVLNTDWQELYEWESAVVGSPTFKVDSTSSIRRTCSLTLASKNTNGVLHGIGFGQDIWLDTYFQVWVGIENMITKDVVYTNMGIYMVDNPTYNYSATDDTFTIKGVDLMSRMTGLRNGNLEGVEYVINAGTNVRKAIIGAIELAGFKKYVVEECQYPTVPNQINVDVGSTIYDILSQLQQIDPNTQMYFDVNGVFHYEPIPTGDNEPLTITKDYWNKSLISLQTDYDFESVKNVIEVVGGTHDIKWYATATVSGSTYTLTMSAYTSSSYRNNLKVGFIVPSKVTNPYVQINSLGAKKLLNSDGSFAQLADESSKYYVARYIADGDYFLFLGALCPRAIVKNTNLDSPYSIDKLGEIRVVLSGGEYDNISTDAQALARAKWELYNRCKLTDSINITCVPILWLDVNQLIEIELPSGEIATYIVTSIDTTFGVTGTQTINASRYYPYYETEVTML